jgi:hypothetical protein
MFTKIQPEQIQLPTFFSNSGDFNISQSSDTGINFNLSRNLTGNFDVFGSLSVGSSVVLVSNSGNSFQTLSGNAALGGSSNNISGSFNTAIGSQASIVSGSRNLDLNGNLSLFDNTSENNTILGGANCIISPNTTGAMIISDKYSSTSSRGNHSLVLNFNSGVFVESELNIEGHLRLEAASSGIFSGNVNLLGLGFITGSRIASERWTTGITSSITGDLVARDLALSGVLVSRDAAVSGVLAARDLAISGVLVDRTANQQITGSKTFASPAFFNSGLYGNLISGERMILNEMNTGIYATGERGSSLYSGEYLYLRTGVSGPKNGWIRFSGETTWT